MRGWTLGLGAVVALGSCTGAQNAAGEDGDDEVAVVDGKGDQLYDEKSALGCAMRKLASTATRAELDRAKVPARSARALLTARAGDDGTPGNADDVYFMTLAELDEVRYVGPITFARLAAAAADARWACGTTKVQLLAFNDFHGNLKPPSGSSGKIVVGPDPKTQFVEAGGVEFLATHVAQLKAQNPNTLVVSAGDNIGATPLLSAAFHDEPTIEALATIGLDVSAVGNHELDEGIDELWRMQYGGCHPSDGCYGGRFFDGARFEYLAANVLDEASGEPVFAPFTVRRVGGVRVAFIGMTLEGAPLVTTAEGVRGLRFLDEAETVNRLVPLLRAQGIEAIVVLLHEGGFATGLYNECTGISGPIFEIAGRLDRAVDVVVSGHTNAAHTCKLDGRLVTSAAHAGRLITDIDLEIDERTGEVSAMAANNVIVTRDVPRDPLLSSLIARWDTLVAPIANRVVAHIEGDLLIAANPAGESTLGDVIADAQLAATRGQGAVAAFMNPGGIRADLVAAQLSGGEQPNEVTFGECFAVQPFSNLLVTLTVTGAQLHTMLEQQWSMAGASEKATILAISSSLHYRWDPTRPIGSRVDPASVTIDGRVVDPAASYRITANNFLADGGDGFSVLKQGTARNTGVIDVDAFQRYLEANTPLAPPAPGRIERQ